jgi:hypothetical protein
VRRAVELILRSLFERQAQHLTRHDERRAKDLRHVILIAQNQDVVQTDYESNLRGQNLYIVAGAPLRPSSFGNLEQLLSRFEANGQQRTREQRERQQSDPDYRSRAHLGSSK